eukprot:COSAG06_NODE_2547_length_6695_cov_5.498636_8_plen_247_part_00
MWFVVSAGVAQASALLSDPDATTRRQVTKRARFRPTCHIPPKASFYQDRLGTIIGKSTPKRQIAVFPLSSTQAWQAIQDAWRGAEEPAAAVLNAISGWRLSMNKRRAEASGVPVHFLGALKIFKTVFSSRFVASTKASLFKFTQTRSRQPTALMTQQRQSNLIPCLVLRLQTEPALHSNRMTQATLDAMMGAVSDAAGIGRRALKLQARALGATQMPFGCHFNIYSRTSIKNDQITKTGSGQTQES